MAETIYRSILTVLEDAADAMTTVSGFRFDYDDINEYKPADKTYPSLMIDLGEESADPPGEGLVNSYTMNADVIFSCTVDDTVANVDTYLFRCHEDILRMMEEEHLNSRNAGLIVADYLDYRIEYTNVRKRPGRIIMRFNLNYRLKRTDPALTT